MTKITLASPKFDESTFSEVVNILKSGNLVQGDKVSSFEKKICEYTGAKFAVAVNSATSGLFASLISAGIKPGDEVILPALSYIATANVIEMIGAVPVFCDINCDNYNINPSLLEECLTNRTKAVIGVHEFGEPFKCSTIADFCLTNDLVLIEDAACALGSQFQGKHIGTYGLAGVFSFHPRKSITCGDGGVVITNSELMCQKIRSFRNHGLENYGGINAGFQSVGLNLRLTEIQAAMLNMQLPALNGFLKKKFDHVNLYDEFLTNSLIKPKINTPGHSWQSYHVLCDTNTERDNLINILAKENIFVSLGAQCMPSEPYYSNKYGFDQKKFEFAYRANKCGLVLPIHEHLTKKDVRKVISVINEVYEDDKR